MEKKIKIKDDANTEKQIDNTPDTKKEPTKKKKSTTPKTTKKEEIIKNSNTNSKNTKNNSKPEINPNTETQIDDTPDTKKEPTKKKKSTTPKSTKKEEIIKNSNTTIRNTEHINTNKQINKNTKQNSNKTTNLIENNNVKENNKITNNKYIKKFIPYKTKWTNILIITILIISITTLTISTFQIMSWKKDSNNTKQQIENIQQNNPIQEIEDNHQTEIIEPPTQEEITPDNPYWNYIKMNLIDADFTNLKNENNQTVGWIQVNGTNVNYPFVQGQDNDFYLTHSFDKSYNDAGWVFMDYRNNPKNFNKNTIIYAHSRLDSTMFGSLQNILKNSWRSNPDNHIIKLATEQELTLWQVFSVYHIPTTSDYLQIDFISDEQFLNFANMLKNRSSYNFNTQLSATDKILTLSTCFSETEKTVLHAKLIKIQKKQN